jgi:hypothetical protein
MKRKNKESGKRGEGAEGRNEKKKGRGEMR